MRLGLMVGFEGEWGETLEKVKIAEDLGYERITAGESWGPSPLPWLAALATHTSKIELGTSILNCYSRTPAAIAQDIASLDRLSQGRALLGLGSSGALVIEQFHGLPFERPLRRLREYVEVFNLLMSGEPLNYEGEVFRMNRGFTLRGQLQRDRVPVYIAAITPRSIRQTGEIADGIIPIHWPKQHFETLRAQLAEGATAAGRDVGELTIAPQVRVHVLDGRNDEAQWDAARQPLHYYVNRMGVFYWQMLSRNGFEAEVAASREAWSRRDADASLKAISDTMVREIQVIGPLESVREQLRERAALGADLQMLYMPPGNPAEVGQILEALIR